MLFKRIIVIINLYFVVFFVKCFVVILNMFYWIVIIYLFFLGGVFYNIII